MTDTNRADHTTSTSVLDALLSVIGSLVLAPFGLADTTDHAPALVETDCCINYASDARERGR